MKNIYGVLFVIALLANATSVKAEDWTTSGFKQYSQTLYQQGHRKQAQWLARWYKARQNQKNGACLNAKQIMNLHYKNDVELKGK